MRIKPALMTDDATTVMRLLEFTDSAFPVGTFSFSNGLETAAEEGLVHDAATLEQYTQDIVRQAAFTDGVAALHAFRGYNLGYYEGYCRCHGTDWKKNLQTPGTGACPGNQADDGRGA